MQSNNIINHQDGSQLDRHFQTHDVQKTVSIEAWSCSQTVHPEVDLDYSARHFVSGNDGCAGVDESVKQFDCANLCFHICFAGFIFHCQGVVDVEVVLVLACCGGTGHVAICYGCG